MAKYIRSLDSNNKCEVASPKESKKNSPKGKRRREGEARRAKRDAANQQTKRPALRTAKKAAGPNVNREKKQILPASIFAGMTPRQIKQAKRRPERLAELQKKVEKANG
jgi:hypothetical protein